MAITTKRYFMEIQGNEPEFIEGVLVGCIDDGQRARCVGLTEANDWINSHQHFVHDNSGLKEIELTLDNPHDESAATRRAILQCIAEGTTSAKSIAEDMELGISMTYYHLKALKDEGKVKLESRGVWTVDSSV